MTSKTKTINDFDVNDYIEETKNHTSKRGIFDNSNTTSSSVSNEQGEPIEQVETAEPPHQSSTIESKTPTASNKMTRRASLEKYRKIFLCTPKISDRKTTYLSKELWERLHKIARTLGDDKMSVTGFVENLTRHHLEQYAEDLEQWKRL